VWRLVLFHVGWIIGVLPSHSYWNRIRARYYRAIGFDIGVGTSFNCNVRIKGKVSIGKFCNCNDNVLIASTGKAKIVIGDYVIIGPNVVLRNANHGFESLEIPIRYQEKTVKDIVIEMMFG